MFIVFLENVLPRLLYFIERNKRRPRLVNKRCLFARQYYQGFKVVLFVVLVVQKCTGT